MTGWVTHPFNDATPGASVTMEGDQADPMQIIGSTDAQSRVSIDITAQGADSTFVRGSSIDSLSGPNRRRRRQYCPDRIWCC